MTAINDSISAITALISIYSVWKINKFNKRQAGLIETTEKLNQLLLEKGKSEIEEQKKARITAYFTENGSSKILKIANTGNNPARNIRFEAINSSDVFSPYELKDIFPYEELDSNQDLTVYANIHSGSPEKATIKLIWDDDHMANNEKTTTLRVF